MQNPRELRNRQLYFAGIPTPEQAAADVKTIEAALASKKELHRAALAKRAGVSMNALLGDKAAQ